MSQKEAWGTRIGLILAMAGNAVGLGNFLRFPIKAVQNGGGEYIIPYLVSFLVLGIPLLFVEWAMGRYGGKNGIHSTPFLLDAMGKKRLWKYLGVFGLFTNFGVIAYYTYIESWTLAYVWETIKGTFLGMPLEKVSEFFDVYVDKPSDGQIFNIPWYGFFFFIITLALNIWILSRGISGGIEKTAMICMPLLILFGIFLAIKGVMLGNTGQCDGCDSAVALNFLWQPSLNGIWNFKTWLEAAGQIFFTLSVGMGTIHCYASYVNHKDDIALNAMSAGWMNEFVEIVLGAAIVIPISVGYFGLEWVQQNAGFMMGFKTMPYLFDQWGAALAIVSGVFWFGLLFFAGITSSLAMGTPWMGFMQDEFGWSRRKSAYTFGLFVLILALPPIILFHEGVFDEYDYWTGTVSLVVFALAEIIIFSWVFGIEKGWKEIHAGADIRVPGIFKFITKFVTPLFIIIILIGALIRPVGDDWNSAMQSLLTGSGWPWHDVSIMNQVFRFNVEKVIYFADGKPTGLLFADLSRLLLVALFITLCGLVKMASDKRKSIHT